MDNEGKEEEEEGGGITRRQPDNKEDLKTRRTRKGITKEDYNKEDRRRMQAGETQPAP